MPKIGVTCAKDILRSSWTIMPKIVILARFRRKCVSEALMPFVAVAKVVEEVWWLLVKETTLLLVILMSEMLETHHHHVHGLAIHGIDRGPFLAFHCSFSLLLTHHLHLALAFAFQRFFSCQLWCHVRCHLRRAYLPIWPWPMRPRNASRAVVEVDAFAAGEIDVVEGDGCARGGECCRCPPSIP